MNSFTENFFPFILPIELLGMGSTLIQAYDGHIGPWTIQLPLDFIMCRSLFSLRIKQRGEPTIVCEEKLSTYCI